MAPSLSIIIPHYNHNEQLPRALDNILSQTLRDIEVVIVDDKSDISCADIIRIYRDKGLNIVLVENTERKYTKESRLIGIENSRGQLITFLDADVVFYKSMALEYHVCQQIDTGVDILHFGTRYSNEENNRQHAPFWLAILAESLTGKNIFQKYVETQCSGHTLWGKIVRRELWLRCLPFARACSVRRYCEDLLLSSLLFFWAQSYRGSSRLGYVYKLKNMDHRKAFGRAATYYAMLVEFIPYIKRHGADASICADLQKIFLETLRLNISRYLELTFFVHKDDFLLPESVFEEMQEHAEPDKAVKILMTGLMLLPKKTL
jgi:glycosyltransferase involved in cell wall biosynthesis